jgi:uncharacterized protein YjbI with pentapeptide repeats
MEAEHSQDGVPDRKAGEITDDLQELRKAVDDAATVVVGLWLSYLFLLFYLAIAAGAVTHIDLLLDNPVKLPFLNVELPLLAFFALAPILFVITHTHTLVHFVLLSGKIKYFHRAIYRQLPEEIEVRAALQRQLPNNIFVQFLAGPDEIRKGGLGVILKIIAWITLVVSPILLLLLLEVRFLPYHQVGITWVHRGAVFADIVLLWMLWPSVLTGRTKIGWPDVRHAKTALLASVGTVWFSCIVATFPGEWVEETLPDIKQISLHAKLFVGPPDVILRRSGSILSNTLILPGFSTFDAQKIDDPRKVEWRSNLVILRGRDLRGAVFISADLTKVDLTSAHLEGADLTEAKLYGASLENAWLQGASLVRAELQGASLRNAQLQGASLRDAHLEGARLNVAHLEGANLQQAQVQGATLDFAILSSTVLIKTQLQGASLRHAEVRDIILDSGNLASADLTSTYYWPKTFQHVDLTNIRCAEGQGLRAAPPVACKPTNDLPIEAQDWLTAIARSEIGEAVYAKSLAETLFRLVCSDKAHSIDILRGVLANRRIGDTNEAASELIELIMGSSCPLATKLTSDDIAMLKVRTTD